MKPSLLFSFVSVFLLHSQSSLAAGDTYVCLYGNNERTIKVVYGSPDNKLPCEVVYEKASGSQVLWNAQNVEGYCETKAAEFIDKQKGWGWDCAKMDSVAAAEVVEPSQTAATNGTVETAAPAPTAQ